MIKALQKQMHNLILNYPMAQDAICALVGKIINQPLERIVVGNGAAELIKIISGHIAKKLIIPVPSFNEYTNAAPSNAVVEFPLEFPSFRPDVDKFSAEARRINADIAVIVTPNNPTSMLVPKSDIIRLVNKLKAFNCMLIVDESFIDFTKIPEENTMESEIDNFSNLAVFKSMSKAYGICGLRIGYMLTSNIKFAETVREGTHIWNINGFAEEFLRLLPEYKNEFIESCIKVRSDRDKMYKQICEINGMTVYKPDANFIYCRIPDSARSDPEIARDMFVHHNIYVKHCLGKTQPESDRYLRIACRTEDENGKLIKALIKVLES
ncbi:MAG: aminotransferase class I/II-fold pyridoxal phosphate-dependent enzyme [Eubacteriales bacterium]